ncbi:unnamed protein product, partial [marine sediment metagenome]
DVVDAPAETDTSLVINAIGNTNVSIGRFAENPYPNETLPTNTLDKFIDIQIENE